MDRNFDVGDSASARPVALRKESVDRNIIGVAPIDCVSSVALRKESVDRNIRVDKTQSPPSVALRKESVDRNNLATS